MNVDDTKAKLPGLFSVLKNNPLCGFGLSGFGAANFVAGHVLQQSRDINLGLLHNFFIAPGHLMDRKALIQARKNPSAVFETPIRKAKLVRKAKRTWLTNPENQVAYSLNKVYEIPQLNTRLLQEERLAALLAGNYHGVYTRRMGIADSEYFHVGFTRSDFPNDETWLIKEKSVHPIENLFGTASKKSSIFISRKRLYLDFIQIDAAEAVEVFNRDLAILRRHLGTPDWSPPSGLLEAFNNNIATMHNGSEKISRTFAENRQTVERGLKRAIYCENILNQLDLKKLPSWKRFFASPNTYKIGGAVLGAIGVGLLIYESYNALYQDGAERRTSYAFGRHTAQFAGRMIGGFVGSVAGLPLGMVGAFAGGMFGTNMGETIADGLYQKPTVTYQMARLSKFAKKLSA